MSSKKNRKDRDPAGAGDKSPAQATPAFVPPPEDQSERRLKYGGNVALVSVIVLVLAVLVVLIAQSKLLRGRSDMTAGGNYTLKPQTVGIIKNLDQKIRLVGLYPKSKDEAEQDYYATVADRLSEYEGKGRNITAEMIDPVKESAKVDQLIADVSKRGGGEEKRYADFLDKFEKETLPQIQKFADEQYAQYEKAIAPMMKDAQGPFLTVSPDTADVLRGVQGSVLRFPEELKELGKIIRKERSEKIPDYKNAVEAVRIAMRQMSRHLNGTVSSLTTVKSDPKAPAEIKAYAEANQPRFEETKKRVDDLTASMSELGELKGMDELRQSLKSRSILVMGEKEFKVIPFDAVWRVPERRDPLRTTSAEDEKVKLRFAGEQPINAAIVTLTSTQKAKIAFIRTGGPPLANQMPMMRQRAPLAAVAERLRQYNCEIIEYDISGMSAMQGRPMPGDATEEQIKDAVWVVVNAAGPQMAGAGPMAAMGGMPNPLGPKLAEHLNNGGSALVLNYFAPPGPMSEGPGPADKLEAALGPWGVQNNTDVIAVHERLPRTGRPTGDIFEQAQRQPVIFFTSEYGQHPVVKNLNSLDSVLVPMMTVKVDQKPGFRASPIIPVPQAVKSWGERNWASVFADEDLKFNDKAEGTAQADLPNTPESPLFAGAVVESDKGNRLVVIGCFQFATDDMVNIPDPRMEDENTPVLRFPANGELFTNSVLWLAKKDQLLSLSPAAVQVERLPPMTKGTAAFLKYGVLMTGLPLIAAGLGVFMFFRRQAS